MGSSAPSWSRELKNWLCNIRKHYRCRLLRGAVSWKIMCRRIKESRIRRLLRGAVSWKADWQHRWSWTSVVGSFVEPWVEKIRNMHSSPGTCRLLRGAVSWKGSNRTPECNQYCRLLRGAVSWKVVNDGSIIWAIVGSFVEPWVEKSFVYISVVCQSCQLLCGGESWNNLIWNSVITVIFADSFVELWVEIMYRMLLEHHWRSVPLRNCELKLIRCGSDRSFCGADEGCCGVSCIGLLSEEI